MCRSTISIERPVLVAAEFFFGHHNCAIKVNPDATLGAMTYLIPGSEDEDE